MATEKAIEKVLDLLTTAPNAQIESLNVSSRSHARNMRNVIGFDNVVAVGISEKVSNNVPTGKLALTFYVEKKMPLTDLTGDKLVPPTIPESLSGWQAIPTDVVEIGKLKLETDSEALIIKDPLQPGYSIGHIDITAGTFGAVVSKQKELFILSNSHVLAKSGIGKKGDAILYPGKADQNGSTDNLVAHLEDFVQFTKGGEYVNNVDCAIARPTAAGLAILTSEIKDLGIPKGTTKPVRGMKIIKVGRTTGKTTGEIKDVHFRTLLDYDFGVGSIGFTDQVFCTRYSLGGDSGSLVLEESTMMAVGLHFSGSSGGEHPGSIFNPIDKVLTALGVELVTTPIDKNKAKIQSAKESSPAKTNKPVKKKAKRTGKIAVKSVIPKTKREKKAKNKL